MLQSIDPVHSHKHIHFPPHHIEHTHTYTQHIPPPTRAQDYASPATRQVAEEVIARESQKMSPHAQQAYERKRKQILEGKRDLYF